MQKGKIGCQKEKSVVEFIVIVESGADARTATKLAERFLKENIEREKQCWEETSLKILRTRGVKNGLTTYLQAVEERLSIIILSE